MCFCIVFEYTQEQWKKPRYQILFSYTFFLLLMKVTLRTGITIFSGNWDTKYVLFVCLCYSLSHVQLFATPWTVACQAPLSTGFSRQEYWSGLPLFHFPGDLPDTEIESCLPHHMKILYHLSHQGRSSILHIYIIKSL